VLATPVMKSFPAERLEGDCERATHVVSRLYLGGFAMAAGESESIAAEASLFGMGASGAQDRSAERLSSEGNAKACQKAQEEGTREAGCSVPLRIGLSPITGRETGDCPRGSTWNGAECIAQPVVTQVECPAGTTLKDGKCVAAVNTDCPEGMSFMSGKGCVAKVAAATTSTPTTASPDLASTNPSCPAGMAALPGGTFRLGERGDTVSVRPFCMDLTEVTVADYKACTRRGSCSAAHREVDGPGIDPALRDYVSGGCNIRHGDRDRHPINCVDWSQAEAYCKANGKRLPSEEEWEWAARGGVEGRAHPWGSAEPAAQLCWKRGATCAVGSFPAGHSVNGVADLSGNVWEWTASRYRDQGYVVRGGSHDTVISAWLSASFSRSHPPAKRHTDLGFRCVR
jgi:formylglycine-generating enzyme